MEDAVDVPLDRITEGVPPPSPDSDVRAEEEEEEFRRASVMGGMSPKTLHLHQTERLIAHYSEENKRLLNKTDQLQVDLDELRPALASLQQYVRSDRISGILCTVGMVIGGALISTASLCADDSAKHAIHGAGWGVIILAAVAIIWSHATGPIKWPKRR